MSVFKSIISFGIYIYIYICDVKILNKHALLSKRHYEQNTSRIGQLSNLRPYLARAVELQRICFYYYNALKNILEKGKKFQDPNVCIKFTRALMTNRWPI